MPHGLTAQGEMKVTEELLNENCRETTLMSCNTILTETPI